MIIGIMEPGKDDWRSNPTEAHELPWAMKKPVIASVQGDVMGGGCEFVMPVNR